MLGPRKHRFSDQKKIRAVVKRGHSVPFQVLGTFLLWFGWYGFNCGSTLSAVGLMPVAARTAVTTTLSAGAVCFVSFLSSFRKISDFISKGGLAAAVLTFIMEGSYGLSTVCNGILAGLVSITSSCSTVGAGTFCKCKILYFLYTF